jgi:hypothetical protein
MVDLGAFCKDPERAVFFEHGLLFIIVLIEPEFAVSDLVEDLVLMGVEVFGAYGRRIRLILIQLFGIWFLGNGASMT